MNNRGQTVFFLFMIVVTILVLALSLADPLKEFVEDARANMDCNNTSISSFDKTGCMVVDMSLFYFIGGLIFITGIVLAAKVVVG